MEFEEDRTGTWHAYGKRMSENSQSQVNLNSFRELQKLAFRNPFPVTENSQNTDYLTKRFPKVAASINTDNWALHLEIGTMALATREAISKQDWSTLSAHFIFIDSVLEAADTELHEAIGMSYLVNLFYGETAFDYAKARTLMPRRLATALEIMERHYEELRK
jgi:hypothetical protein